MSILFKEYRMTANEISQRLSENVRSVVLHIFPNAKELGSDWVVGSTHGESGKSLRICKSGSKAGIWCDFSTGQSGDLLDLWSQHFNITIKQAMKESCDWLGLDLKKDHFTRKKIIHKPVEEPEHSDVKEGVAEYFVSRGISNKTI